MLGCQYKATMYVPLQIVAMGCCEITVGTDFTAEFKLTEEWCVSVSVVELFKIRRIIICHWSLNVWSCSWTVTTCVFETSSGMKVEVAKGELWAIGNGKRIAWQNYSGETLWKLQLLLPFEDFFHLNSNNIRINRMGKKGEGRPQNAREWERTKSWTWAYYCIVLLCLLVCCTRLASPCWP